MLRTQPSQQQNNNNNSNNNSNNNANNRDITQQYNQQQSQQQQSSNQQQLSKVPGRDITSSPVKNSQNAREQGQVRDFSKCLK